MGVSGGKNSQADSLTEQKSHLFGMTNRCFPPFHSRMSMTYPYVKTKARDGYIFQFEKRTEHDVKDF